MGEAQVSARQAHGRDDATASCCLPEKFTVETEDGVSIAASGFPPHDPDAGKDKLVIVNPTAATPRYYYGSLCCFLAAQGFPAVTYDYRGIGDSRPASLKKCDYALSDWGQRDFTAVIAWLKDRFPDLRLIVIGHGIGGQLPALAGNAELIEGLITLSAASHYHGHYAERRGRKRFYATTRYVLPRLVERLGYVPVKKLKLGEDLPKNVFLEWARWCHDPQYLFGDGGLAARERAARLRCPVLATVVEDDIWAPEAAVRALHAHYVNAAVDYWPIRPVDFGVSRLGHLGPFARPVRDLLWPALAQWIEQV